MNFTEFNLSFLYSGLKQGLKYKTQGIWLLSASYSRFYILLFTRFPLFPNCSIVHIWLLFLLFKLVRIWPNRPQLTWIYLYFDLSWPRQYVLTSLDLDNIFWPRQYVLTSLDLDNIFWPHLTSAIYFDLTWPAQYILTRWLVWLVLVLTRFVSFNFLCSNGTFSRAF